MRALVRSIPSTFADAITTQPKSAPIDVARARTQHGRYVEALAAAGAEVVRLPADDRFPDGCFVEDCAIVAKGTALITRPGAESRRDEVAAVRDALASLRVEHTAAPATLDGGDCMRVGGRFYVGVTARTNEAGITRVREVFGETMAIPLTDVLHLKCVCSPIADDAILLAEGTIPRERFAGLRVIDVPREEADAANAVAIGRTLLIAAGCPRTERRLRDEGFDTIAVDTSEIRKADGALTCLSVLF